MRTIMAISDQRSDFSRRRSAGFSDGARYGHYSLNFRITQSRTAGCCRLAVSVKDALPMDVIPVLDLMGGQVVRGVGGKRDAYAPVHSCLANSSLPGDIARALRETLGLTRLYIADLDAILADAPQWPVLEALAADGFELLADAGLRDAARAERLIACGAAQVIAGLETLPGPVLLDTLMDRFSPQQVVFSLDLMDGRPLGDVAAWETSDPAAIAARAVSQGVGSLIVLDLSGVGMARGVSTRDLCRRLRHQHPDISLITGGGVREVSDLRELCQLGVNGVLVASALHDGAIGLHDIETVQS
jgi:phosphoribosylformimino-5-aminoimidazole carboxamide ribotide isomerase